MCISIKGGYTEDYIEGPFEKALFTMNLPVLSSIIGTVYEGDTPFQAEVFFINTAKAMQLKFGVPYFSVVDPRFADFHVPVAVRGNVTYCISDYKSFVKYHQLVTFSLEDFRNKIYDSVCRCVKDAVTSAPAENNISVVNIESKIDLINEKVEMNIKDRFAELFGIEVTGVDLSAIDVDKESEAYTELMSVTKDISKKKVEADILNYEEQLRIQREEGQYAMHMSTQQQNLGAYQTEKSSEVGIAGANALGKMAENGAGNVNLGGETGFNPMTMMAGMAVGSAVGQNIAGVMNGAMNLNVAPFNQTGGTVPPPIPEVTYFLAKDGKPAGPYNIQVLTGMVANGEFKADSLVWKQGMSEWQRADAQSDLKLLFPPTL